MSASATQGGHKKTAKDRRITTKDNREKPVLGQLPVNNSLLDDKLECGPMHNLMIALPNVAGALCSTPQSLANAHY